MSARVPHNACVFFFNKRTLHFYRHRQENLSNFFKNNHYFLFNVYEILHTNVDNSIFLKMHLIPK